MHAVPLHKSIYESGDVYFWKCNFPMNNNVCLSVCRSVGVSVCLSVKNQVWGGFKL